MPYFEVAKSNTQVYLLIYLLGANKMEHLLTDGDEQHGSINFKKILILHMLCQSTSKKVNKCSFSDLYHVSSCTGLPPC